jgi:hypothetical protein
VESLEGRPFGGYAWEDSYQKKGPGPADSLRFSDNRSWFVGLAVMYHFHLFK